MKSLFDQEKGLYQFRMRVRKKGHIASKLGKANGSPLLPGPGVPNVVLGTPLSV